MRILATLALLGLTVSVAQAQDPGQMADALWQHRQ